MKNKILVTGHKGFLGGALWKVLKKNKKNKLIGRDINLYSSNRQYDKNYTLLKKNILKKIDIIIHLAGVSTNYDPEGVIYKKLSIKANFKDTLYLAMLAKKNGVKKFIFASSTSVYGNKKNYLVDENSSLSPTTSYGKSKSMTEKELIKMSGPNFKVIILRMVTLFGVSKRMRFDLLVNNLVVSYIKNGQIILLSDGKKIRPQIHINDAIKAYEYFIENDIKQNYITINVGKSDYNLTVGQIAKKIAKILNCKVVFGKTDKDKRSYQVSFAKLNKLIKFKKNENTIEANTQQIKSVFLDKKRNFLENKNFYNLSTVKFLIENNEIKKIL